MEINYYHFSTVHREEARFKSMIGILDYGLGNVIAFQNIYNRLGVKSVLVSNTEQLSRVNKIIIPGVGAFDWAIRRLKDSKLIDLLNERVISERVPVLGVCVGMQVMLESSEEGESPGLGWIQGTVEQLHKTGDSSLPLPHMGWNNIELTDDNPLFDGLRDARFYFLHSYCVSQSVKADSVVFASYGKSFAAAISKSNVHGVQFHPEKSHHWGVRLLTNFEKI